VDQLRRASELLSASTSIVSIKPLLEFLGFDQPPLPLDDAAVRELALMPCISATSVARGTGCLRALIIETSSSVGTRDLVQHTAARLAAKVPHLHWVVIALNRDARELSIACWESRRPPRVVALIADQQRILKSDSETLCALSAAQSGSDILTHVRWIELLGREAITRRFFRALNDVVGNLASALPAPIRPADRRELSLLCVSRLLFLSFLETKGWLNADFEFLANSFARCGAGSGGYHRHVLQPLFFGTLNTRYSARAGRAKEFGRIPFLNGGLFTRSHLERKLSGAFFGDDALEEIFARLLTSFRFSAREDSGTWSETAIDPEILGKAFEALMAADERKTSGAFYTPQRLVEHVTESALVAALAPEVDHSALRNLLSTGELPDPDIRAHLLGHVERLRVLDPACGSGAFLVHALERLAELRLRLGEIGTASAIRRRSLTASIFGVDINPMAVWLCQLRLWLAIVIDSGDTDPMRITPLPNLDRQIRVGDSLSGGSFAPDPSMGRGRRLALLRARYIRSAGPRKKNLSRQLDREERSEAVTALERLRTKLHAERREILLAARAKDLFGGRTAAESAMLDRLRSLKAGERAATERRRRLEAGAALPFAFNIHFADVASAGGFDVVIGNPPWVRIHNISAPARRSLHRDFTVLRNCAWRRGIALSGSGPAFASQIDLAALFVERSTSLLRDKGALALLLPTKLWSSLSGGGVRELVRTKVELVALEDMTESRSGFDAAVYPSLLVGRRSVAREPDPEAELASAVFRNGSAIQWELKAGSLALDNSPGSPWLLVPGEVRRAFDVLSDSGIPLAESPLGRPLLGVKTGCNAAYIVEPDSISNGLASVQSLGRSARIDSRLLRPVVRGETITAWGFQPNGERILWTHAQDGKALAKLPPATEGWLRPWRPVLERRSDSRGSSRWWSLFRTEGAALDRPRVVWGDFGKSPRALILDRGEDVVPLNTCYVVRCTTREDALALATLLNGPLMAAWLNTIAEPARGGYRRYLGWTVSLMPLPRDWAHARDELCALGERAIAGDTPTQHDLLLAALRAFRVRKTSVEALLSWTNRS
jgi:N-6 DNA Methylase